MNNLYLSANIEVAMLLKGTVTIYTNLHVAITTIYYIFPNQQ